MLELNRVWLIARRELKQRTRQRTYIGATIAQLLFVIALAASPIIIAKFDNKDPNAVETRNIVVADANNIVGGSTLETVLKAVAGKHLTLTISTADSADAARARVDDDSADAALIVEKGPENEPAFTIVTPNGKADSLTGQVLTASANAVVVERRIQKTGLTPEQVQQAYAPPQVTNTKSNDDDSRASDTKIVAYVLAYAGTFALFMAVTLYGNWIAQGVVEEKSSRIMEIMINAATPRDLLAGKVLGILTAALLQFGPMILAGTLILGFQKQIAKLVGVDPDRLINVDFQTLASTSLFWLVVYFLLGFALFGALFAGLGSLVSRQEEVSVAVAPMTTVMMLGYFAAFYTLSNPDSAIAKTAFLFPGTSPFAGVPRVLLGNPTTLEKILSVVLLVAAVVAAMWFAGRLYRIGVLMYGQRPSWRSIMRASGLQEVTR